jgi:hypothetical protein
LVQVGRARIEFHGDNLAETVEEEREAAAREERQARYWDQCFLTMLRIRILRIHMSLGLPNPHQDPLVKDMDPDPSIAK